MNKNIYSGIFHDTYMEGARRDTPWNEHTFFGDVPIRLNSAIKVVREFFMAGWMRNDTYETTFARIIKEEKYLCLRKARVFTELIDEKGMLEKVLHAFYEETHNCPWTECISISNSPSLSKFIYFSNCDTLSPAQLTSISDEIDGEMMKMGLGPEVLDVYV